MSKQVGKMTLTASQTTGSWEPDPDRPGLEREVINEFRCECELVDPIISCEIFTDPPE